MDASSVHSLVLEQYYGTIRTLSSYLDALLPSIAHSIVIDNDPESFRNLLETTLVAYRAPEHKIPRMFYELPEHSQTELIGRAQYHLLKNCHDKAGNILTLGYEMGGYRNYIDVQLNGVSNYATNSMVFVLTTDDWALLLQRIGDKPMSHLLTTASIFLKVGEGNWCQAAGPRIYDLSPLPKGPLPAAEKNSSNKPKGNILTRMIQHNLPANITFCRSRMFYARPVNRYSKKGIQIGLPTIHILNQIEGQRIQESSLGTGTGTESKEHARHLAKYIFPRQYHIHNVFETPKQFGPWPFRDYTARDDIQKRNGMQTPPRLKQVLDLLEAMISRHQKTHYRSILERTCASKLKQRDAISMDPATILELMSEASAMLPTQDAAGHLSNVTAPLEDDRSQDKTLIKPRFAEFQCSAQEVTHFAITITKSVIPEVFWGSDENFERVSQYISDFICSRRYESVTLHGVMQGIKCGAMTWTKLPAKPGKRPQTTQSDALKCLELIEDFMYWYFDSFLIPLLKTTFYCTESATYRNRVLFFRQDDWKHLCQPLLDRLCSTTFQKLPKNLDLESSSFGYSGVRLLPKESGVRPIINLRRKPTGKTGKVSINQILQATFHVLTYERDAQPDLIGAGVLGHKEIYGRLKLFKQRTLAPNGTLPKLYFVKMDVQACFDTIEQGRLLEIIRSIIKEDYYTVSRFVQVAPKEGGVKKIFTKKAVPETTSLPFIELISELASSLRNIVFADQVVYKDQGREQLLALLEEHIHSNTVKIGNDFYKQKVGIPQGSILSTVLCNFFYGDMETSSKFRFTQDPRCLLLRYVDDYLFLTTDLSKAKAFFLMMSQGHPEYGCFISPDKTVTNFECDNATTLYQRQKDVHWCGLVINTRNLNVSADYSRYDNSDLSDTLTVGKGKNSGLSFRNKLYRMIKIRCHILFTDTSLNSFFTVHLNIYENFLISAMKTVRYLKLWNNDQTNRPFIISSICEAIQVFYVSLKRQEEGKLAREFHGVCDISKDSVLWLGYYAFYLILRCKETRIGWLLEAIRSKLRAGQFWQIEQSGKFNNVLCQGLIHMKNAKF